MVDEGVPVLSYVNNDGTNVEFFVDGTDYTDANLLTPPGTLSIGGENAGALVGSQATGLEGMIAEVFVFDKTLSAAEQTKLNTYFGIKYGITMSTDYVSASGTTIWDAATLSAYGNSIFGIGLDSASGLNQKQATSQTNGNLVIALGGLDSTNAANSNTFSADNSFLLIGNDLGSLTLQTAELPTTTAANRRIAREWKVAETGSVNNLYLQFGGDSLEIPEIPTNFILMIDTDGDGDFTTGTPTQINSDVAGKANFSGVDLNNGDVFTLGWMQPAPAGLVEDLVGWYKANEGLSTGANNLVQNPQFASGTANWSQLGQVSISGEARFNLSTTTADGRLWQDIQTVPGQSYTFACYAYNSGTGTVNMRLEAQDGTGGQVIASREFGKSVSGGLNSFESVNFIARSTTTRIMFVDVSQSATSDLYIDEVFVVANDVQPVQDDKVPFWKDFSQHANHAISTQTASHSGKYQENTNLFNSHPSILFDNSNDWYNMNGMIEQFGGFDPITMFVVSDNNATDAFDAILGIHNNTTNVMFLGVGTSNLNFQPNVDNTEINTRGKILTSAVLNGTSNKAYFDGLEIASSTNALISQNSAYMNYSIGQEYDATVTDFFSGEIAEIIMYKQNMNDIDRQKIESYLALKYGFTLNNTDNSATIEEGDYVASNGNVIWDGGSNSAIKDAANGGTVSASSFLNATYPATDAFDNQFPDGSNIWIASTTSGWIQYELPSTKVIDGFSMRLRWGNSVTTGNRAPKNFEFQGSNDGSSWTTLRAFENISNWEDGELKYFSTPNSTTYSYYRIDVTENNGDVNYVEIGEIELYENFKPYHNDVAGIGRDDASSLNQKQSVSKNSSAILNMALNSIEPLNSSNTGTFATDTSYVVWGNNNFSLDFDSTVSGLTGISHRMERVWKVQETGTVGNVYVAIPNNISFADPLVRKLVVSSDGVFDGSGETVYDLTDDGAYLGASVDFSAGEQYITFATLIETKSPGAVNPTAIRLWLKADHGVENASDVGAASGEDVKIWKDFSGNENNPVQTTVANQPTYLTDTFNFNPAISFTPNTDVLTHANDSLDIFNRFSIFIVRQKNIDNGTNDVHFSIGTLTADPGNDNGIFMAANSTDADQLIINDLADEYISVANSAPLKEIYLNTYVRNPIAVRMSKKRYSRCIRLYRSFSKCNFPCGNRSKPWWRSKWCWMGIPQRFNRRGNCL